MSLERVSYDVFFGEEPPTAPCDLAGFAAALTACASDGDFADDELPTSPRNEDRRAPRDDGELPLRSLVQLRSPIQSRREIPTLLVEADELTWFELDARTLALVRAADGHTTIGALAARTGVSADDATLRLGELAMLGVVAFR
jgi:hypothetical protein